MQYNLDNYLIVNRENIIIQERLKSINPKTLKKEARHKREHNINTFSKISREGLAYNHKERLLLLYTTRVGEKIYIQYPGKESVSSDKAELLRPWDFRPKLQKRDGTFMEDLTFKDIWNDLARISAQNEKTESTLAEIATIFFRMAVMVDHCELNNPYNTFNSKNMSPISSENINWYSLTHDCDILDYIGPKIGDIRNVSFEAYLYYNDLLAQNEDCKYYFRDIHIKKNNWDSNTGRYNNLMTHVNILGFLKGNLEFTSLVNSFQNGRGVAPATQKSLPEITNNLVILKP